MGLDLEVWECFLEAGEDSEAVAEEVTEVAGGQCLSSLFLLYLLESICLR